jgi:hypothetical protein
MPSWLRGRVAKAFTHATCSSSSHVYEMKTLGGAPDPRIGDHPARDPWPLNIKGSSAGRHSHAASIVRFQPLPERAKRRETRDLGGVDRAQQPAGYLLERLPD